MPAIGRIPSMRRQYRHGRGGRAARGLAALVRGAQAVGQKVVFVLLIDRNVSDHDEVVGVCTLLAGFRQDVV